MTPPRALSRLVLVPVPTMASCLLVPTLPRCGWEGDTVTEILFIAFQGPGGPSEVLNCGWSSLCTLQAPGGYPACLVHGGCHGCLAQRTGLAYFTGYYEAQSPCTKMAHSRLSADTKQIDGWIDRWVDGEPMDRWTDRWTDERVDE